MLETHLQAHLFLSGAGRAGDEQAGFVVGQKGSSAGGHAGEVGLEGSLPPAADPPLLLTLLTHALTASLEHHTTAAPEGAETQHD